MTKSVLLTGASGYIALHVFDALSRGYRVIGTVRSQEKADNILRQFKVEYPNAQIVFEIVEDIAVVGAFYFILRTYPEITDVIHTASPFSFGLNKDLKEAYLKPATQGTENVLTAVQKYGKNVKHVIYKSSFAAVYNIDKFADKSFVHNENTWNPITWDEVENEAFAYNASKKYAEKLAQDFVVEHKPSWTLTTVNPPYVLGPQKFESSLASSTLNTSAEILNKLLSSDPNDTHFFDANPAPISDVRDVALCHVLPIENDSLGGKRLLLHSGNFVDQALLNSLNKQLPEL